MKLIAKTALYEHCNWSIIASSLLYLYNDFRLTHEYLVLNKILNLSPFCIM